MKKILVVFNSRSGRQKAFSYKRIIFKRFKEEGIAFKFIYISMLPLIKDIEKYDTIVAVGGDGTVLGVLPYIVNSSRKLGIIPCGTANLFAEGLLIPSNINKALDIILSELTGQVCDDFVIVRQPDPEIRIGQYFDYYAFGFDAIFFRHFYLP